MRWSHWLLAAALGSGCEDWDSLSRNYKVGVVEGGPYNYAFVTSTTHRPGELGGLAGADQICMDHARDAGLEPATFMAWLSTSTVDASSRFTGARGWIRVDGRPFADTIAGVVQASQLFMPLRIDELGNDVIAPTTELTLVATGTLRDGAYSTHTAADWTDTAVDVTAGDASATGRNWTDGAMRSGGDAMRLYCLGTDHDVPLVVPRVAGRTAFFSTGEFQPGGGIAAADTFCQADADANGLSGTYRALLSTTTADAASRFDLDGPTWVRVDGVPWLERASDLAAGSVLATLNVDATGAARYFAPVWSGSSDPNARSLGAIDSCSDWTSTAGMGRGGRAEFSNFYFFRQWSMACSAVQPHLYCLEE
jgi:hypothetical protein